MFPSEDPSPSTPIDPEAVNRSLWDAMAPVHRKSYDITRLCNGGVNLDRYQLEEVGDVSGKKLLHLQCHIGTDTLSWNRLGAIVTGLDFSPESIRQAESLCEELGLVGRFVCRSVYDPPAEFREQFDIVYSTQGVFAWLSDLSKWAEVVASCLKPGGFVYLMDSHPVTQCLAPKPEGGFLQYEPYRRSEPGYYEWDQDYSDSEFHSSLPNYQWLWPLGDIVNALIGAGLRIDFLHEFDSIFYPQFPGMIPAEEYDWWRLPDSTLPLTFSLRASKR